MRFLPLASRLQKSCHTNSTICGRNYMALGRTSRACRLELYSTSEASLRLAVWRKKVGPMQWKTPNLLPYDPGLLPTKPAPSKGESLLLEIPGLPPIKTISQSIRNQRHPHFLSFQTLRKAATVAMAGRAWYFGAIAIDMTIFSPTRLERWGLNDYLGGIMDTLDGSSGQTFTYLPIVYQDDCQVCNATSKWIERPQRSYRLKILFK